MALSSNDYLSTLINTGADAQNNLYELTFKLYKGNAVENLSIIEELKVRTEKFDTPKLGANTKKFVYQNIEVEKLLPSSSLEKRLNLDFRLDANYKLFNALKSTLPINAKGEYDNPSYYWTITASALNANNNDYEVVCTWLFNKCYLVDLSSFNYSYNSSNAITIRSSFVYDYVTIGEDTNYPKEDESNVVTTIGTKQNTSTITRNGNIVQIENNYSYKRDLRNYL